MTGSVVTVGSFDGVHRGHQAVLAEIARRARAGGRDSVVVTFEPHPLEVVNPPAAPRLLTTLDEKRALLAAAGVSRVAVLPFTTALSQQGPDEFVRMLRAEYAMHELVLGYDHGFGRGRSGDVATVRALGAAQGFAVDVVEAVRDDGTPISSTLIRTAVAHGHLDQAGRWLGRPYAVTGRVERGAGRGRQIGVPTANVALPDGRKLLPPDGVYAVWVSIRGTGNGEGGRVGGVMNQGSRPTFGVLERGLEVHLLDFTGELVGEALTIEWVRRLRDVRTFPSREALVAQIAADLQAGRTELNLQGDG
jgi:riboflavin kinase/FMN adenylyltransferase